MRIILIFRKCSKCGDVKQLDEFYVCKSRGRVYIKNDCKICFNRAKHKRARRKAFLELTTGVKDAAAKRRAYYKLNKDKINEKRRERITKKFSNKVEDALKEGDVFDKKEKS